MQDVCRYLGKHLKAYLSQTCIPGQKSHLCLLINMHPAVNLLILPKLSLQLLQCQCGTVAGEDWHKHEKPLLTSPESMQENP